MFNWRGQFGETFDWAVTRYEFPDATEDYDANWLVVDVSVALPAGTWAASSACLLTSDLLDLSYWLTDLEAERADFWLGYDGDLTLTCLGWFRGHAAVAVKLSDRLSNPAIEHPGERGRDLLVVWLSSDDVANARTAVERTIGSFPARGEHGRKMLSWREERRSDELRRRARSSDSSRRPQSELQAQYLAFIHYYRKVHRRPPAETDIQRYFSATPPSVHQMILRLEKLGLVSRVTGRARSIQVLVDATEIPPLQ